MKSFTHILLVALMLVPYGASVAAPLSGTAGSNLTAYNPSGGAINNNEWNSLMNGRSGSTTAATADFGNCNSVILRCASPKCGNGGCTSIDVATPIVAGCVASNSACKQYGDELTQYIAAQLVASSNAKANAQMAAAQSAAASAAAEQNAMQMQQMQMQMQQMQEQMAAQNAEQIAQLQSALAEQQRATEDALAQASAAGTAASNAATAAQNAAGAITAATTTAASGITPTTVMEGLTEAQRIAANAGVSADILAREQVAGQILTYLEDAQQNLKNANTAMQNAFAYAGCTTKGDNCVGPKRVSVFRQKAMEFFEPYDAVLDNLYDALVLAQSVGVDITDIYMMLNGSCNVWGEYLCYNTAQNRTAGGKKLVQTGKKCKTVNGKQECEDEYSYVDVAGDNGGWATYDKDNCQNGKSVQSGEHAGAVRGGIACVVGMVIPPEDSPSCTLNRTITDTETVQRNFLFAEDGDRDENVRIGCASSALESSKFFRNRKKGSSIDIETLERLVSQDAPAIFGNNKYSSGSDDELERYKYCALTSTGYANLERAVATKKLPSKVCVKDGMLRSIYQTEGRITSATFDRAFGHSTGYSNPDYRTKKQCESPEIRGTWNDAEGRCTCNGDWEDGICFPK